MIFTIVFMFVLGLAAMAAALGLSYYAVKDWTPTPAWGWYWFRSGYALAKKEGRPPLRAGIGSLKAAWHWAHLDST
jgi:hypothetical protein